MQVLPIGVGPPEVTEESLVGTDAKGQGTYGRPEM